MGPRKSSMHCVSGPHKKKAEKLILGKKEAEQILHRQAMFYANICHNRSSKNKINTVI